jgi:hypothetical protein
MKFYCWMKNEIGSCIELCKFALSTGFRLLDNRNGLINRKDVPIMQQAGETGRHFTGPRLQVHDTIYSGINGNRVAFLVGLDISNQLILAV